MGIAEDSVNISWKSIAKRMHIKLPAWRPRPPKIPRFIKVLLVLALLAGAVGYAVAFIKIYPQKQSVGYFARECSGTCEVNYTITADSLIIDRLDNSTGKKTHSILKGDFNELKFGVPLVIILHPKNFGCPDCADGGALTMGFTYRGTPYGFALDYGYDPWYFKDMGDSIGDRIKKIEAICPVKD